MTIERGSVLLLDALGGVAGDMFAAAVLDAFPDLEAPLLEALHDAGVSSIVKVARLDHDDGLFHGARFDTQPVEAADKANGTSEDGHHAHYHYSDLHNTLKALALPAPVVARALDIMARLARAEGSVHGVPYEQAVLHEVGAWDSLADIVSAAWLIDALEGARWFCRPLPIGSGRVRGAHGMLPVPAPATVELLRDMPLFDDGIAGERITPTGAAILAHLEPDFGAVPKLRMQRTGTGFGTRRMPGVSNALRLLVCSAEQHAGAALEERQLVELRFEIDDQGAEDLAGALEYLRGRDGVLELTQAPLYGKKGRLVTQVQMLLEPGVLDATLNACLAETTTLGVRWSAVTRVSVPRSIERDGSVRVKRSELPGGTVRRKAEHDDLARIRGREAREAARRRAEDDSG